MTLRPFFPSGHPFRLPATPANVAPAEVDLARSQLAAAGPIRLMLQRDAVATFDATTATTTARLVQYAWAANAGYPVPIGTVIPWNPAWMPGDVGNDRTVIIHDNTSGKTVELWMVGTAPTFWEPKGGGLGDAVWHFPNYPAAFWRWGLSVAVAQASVIGNVFTESWDPKVIGMRGSGGRKVEGLVLIDHLDARRIPGVIGFKTPRTRVGPEFIRPARRSELRTLADGQRGGVVTKILPADQTTPHGTAWKLTWTREQIEYHASKYASAGTAAWDSIYTILEALNEFGAVTQETSGEQTGVMGIECGWTPQNSARWAAHGITSAADNPVQRALAGLPATAFVPAAARP